MNIQVAGSLACLALLLSGCASAGVAPGRPTITPGVPYALSAAEQALVKKGVISVLKDPTSALFGEMKGAKTADGVITVCGYVNGKNSFGGYVGDKPFAGVIAGEGSAATFAVAAMGGTDSATYATYSVCRQSGISLS